MVENGRSFDVENIMSERKYEYAMLCVNEVLCAIVWICDVGVVVATVHRSSDFCYVLMDQCEVQQEKYWIKLATHRADNISTAYTAIILCRPTESARLHSRTMWISWILNQSVILIHHNINAQTVYIQQSPLNMTMKTVGAQWPFNMCAARHPHLVKKRIVEAHRR